MQQVNDQNLITVHAKLTHLKQFSSFFQRSAITSKYLFSQALQQAFLNKTLAKEEKGELLHKLPKAYKKHEPVHIFLLFQMFHM